MWAKIRAQHSAVCAWAGYPGDVAGEIHPWLTKRQRYSAASVLSAAAVAVACSPHKTSFCLTSRLPLPHVLFHSGLGKEQRVRRHQSGKTIEEREVLYIYTNAKLTGPRATLIPLIFLPMVSSKNDHARANIAGLIYL
jgi:hypothetical protein